MTTAQKTVNHTQLAEHLGITVLSEDMERIVAAINNAYQAGLQDGAAFEREACAQVCEGYGTSVTTKDCAEAIRARGAA